MFYTRYSLYRIIHGTVTSVHLLTNKKKNEWNFLESVRSILVLRRIVSTLRHLTYAIYL